MAGYYNSLYNTYSTGNPVMDSIPSVFGTSTQVLQVNSAGDSLEWAAGGGGGGGSSSYSTLYIQDATTGYTATDGAKLFLSGLNFIIKNQEAAASLQLQDSTGLERIGFSSTATKMYSPDATHLVRIDNNSIIAQGSGVNIYNAAGTSSTAFKTDVNGHGEINTVEAGKNIYLNTTATGAVIIAGILNNKNSINTDLTDFSQCIGHNSATLPTFSGTADFNTLIGSNTSTAITGNRNLGAGYNSLKILTAGNNNISLGYDSLRSLAIGEQSVGIGSYTLQAFNGISSTAVGYNAGYTCTGNNNTFFGADCGRYLLSGTSNVVLGYLGASFTSGNTTRTSNTLTCIGASTSLTDGTSWTNSTALGYQASVTASNQCKIGNASVTSLVPGGDNVMDLGSASLQFKDVRVGGVIYNKNSINTDLTTFNQIKGHNSATLFTISGTGNTFLGSNRSTGTLSGNYNTGLGFDTMRSVTSGGSNFAFGPGSLDTLTIGEDNIAIGLQSGYTNNGYHNIFNGSYSGHENTGSYGIFIGYQCGQYLTSGNYNTIIGEVGGLITNNNTSQTSNRLTCIGASSTIADGTAWTNSIVLGYQASVTASNQCKIGNASLTSIVCNTNDSCDLGTSAIKYKANYSNINVPLYSGQGSTSYTVLNDTNILLNPSGTYTLTLPAAASWLGRVINIKEINTTYAVDSATSNINHNGSTSAVIFAIGTSNSCTLVSDGSNWVVFSRTLSV